MQNALLYEMLVGYRMAEIAAMAEYRRTRPNQPNVGCNLHRVAIARGFRDLERYLLPRRIRTSFAHLLHSSLGRPQRTGLPMEHSNAKGM
jgi:hypothetical protein